MKAGFIFKWAVLLLTTLLCSLSQAREAHAGMIAAADLPVEARQTLDRIKHGGPFPYAKDGAIFGNYERQLPTRPRGYYREYTVRTPGMRGRGARRLVAGGQPPVSAEYYYTHDHYQTFRRIKE
jgi:ribonuclease T1